MTARPASPRPLAFPLSRPPPRALLLALALLAALPAGPARAQGPLPTEILPPDSVGAVLGRVVVDAGGDEIGRIVDVLVDRRGRPRAAVIDAGGFLGIGVRRVAVAWETLRFSPIAGETRITEDLTLDEVASAPEFRGIDGPVTVVVPRSARP